MIIKLALLDASRGYAERLLDFCREKYADKLEISCFSDPAILAESLERERCDVLLVDETLTWEEEKTPAGTAFAWLTEERYKERDGKPAVCRYQRVEQLYREILGLYAESNAQALKGGNYLGEGARVLAVTSASGGSGASTVAAALAVSLAARKQRVTYLNLEAMGDPGLYFSGEGRETFSELLYALKSNRANLALRIESIVRTDPCGVRFFAAPANPLELDEMTEEELERLLRELCQSGENDVVVLDVPFSRDGVNRKALDQAAMVLVVSDGAYAADLKLRRLCQGLQIVGEKDLLERMRLLGNRGAAVAEDCGVKVLGVLPEYVGSDRSRMLQTMAEHALIRELQ